MSIWSNILNAIHTDTFSTEQGEIKLSVKKPELDKVWQTWIKIDVKLIEIEEFLKIVPKMIREKVSIFSKLLNKKEIDWYCFLIHPFPEDKDHLYFHIRFSKTNKDKLELPEYCIKTQKEKLGPRISGIDESLLKSEDIREAWKIIGEQSELIIKLVQIYKNKITNQQFVQFMHFNMNMMGLGHKSRFHLQEGNVFRFLSF